MKCAYCTEPYNPEIGCCNEAAMNLALIALDYHTECNHTEVVHAKIQLKRALNRSLRQLK